MAEPVELAKEGVAPGGPPPDWIRAPRLGWWHADATPRDVDAVLLIRSGDLITTEEARESVDWLTTHNEICGMDRRQLGRRSA